MSNTFKIVIASYNNEDWVEYNLASVLNQTYTDYEVYYIDDCSDDNTVKRVQEIIEGNPKFHLVINEKNLGAIYNQTRFIKDFNDQDILILLDGDDWLYDENVLEKLNTFYNENDPWMTYGKFYEFTGSDEVWEAYPQNTPYPNHIHDSKSYRSDLWRASHMRTYRVGLLKKVDLDDLKSGINNEFYWHAADLALQYPCLEMCPKNKIGVVDFPTYIYNGTPQNKTRTLQRETTDNQKFEVEIRNRKKYEQIKGL